MPKSIVMSHVERRRHVRLKPIAELPARAVLASSGLVQESLEVLDISAGGLALVRPPSSVSEVTVGARIDLRLTLGSEREHVVAAFVRWMSAEAFGVELVDPSPDAEKAVRRYVGELLERGMSV